MRKIYLSLSFIVLSVLAAFSQSPRTSLVEHFTQASCGPCASYNPGLKTMLDNTTASLVSVKYQTSWPGFDPMNKHNPSEVQTRVTYYGVNSVPNPVFEGNVHNGTTGFNDGVLTTRQDSLSPFTIEVSHDFDEGFDSIKVNVKIKATEAVSGANLALHIAVVEEYISFSTPPGTNGETEFYNVMKKMLPNSNGTNIGSTFAVNDSTEYTFAWKYKNVYDPKELGAVAWIQNLTTKEVYQAGKSPASSTTAKSTSEVGIIDVSDYPLNTCDGNFNTKVTIRNHGSSNLTNLKINYSVNGGTTTTENWTGNLGFLESEEVILPIEYTPTSADNIKISVSDPNGTTDPYADNDDLTVVVEKAQKYQNYVFLSILLDNYASETSWELIKKSTGAVVKDGGPYVGQNGQLIEKLFILDDQECYEFKLYDSGNDGMTSGYYRLQAGDKKYILSGSASSFISKEVSTSFEADASLELKKDTAGLTAVSEEEIKNTFALTPNPTDGLLTISTNQKSNNTITIFDATGREVRIIKSNRKVNLLDISELDKGVYYIQVRNEFGTNTKKLIKN